MLQIDDTFYSTTDFQKQDELFDSFFKLNDENQKPIAVCLQDTQTWLALCLYFKKQNVSVMPIHPSTPLTAAKRLAKLAGCDTLYFHEITQSIELTSSELSNTQKTSFQDTPFAGLIQMSSGTTGEPKCIVRSWQSIDIEVDNYIKAFSLPNTMTPVIACPTTHSYGLISGVLVALARGKTPIVITSINPKYLIKQLLSCEQPLLYASPTLLRSLMRLWPKQPQLHAAMTSGTMMSQVVFDELQAKIIHLFQQYGCSEAGCISVNQKMTTPQAIGEPLPHWQVDAGESIGHLAEIVATPSPEFSEDLSIVYTQDLGYFVHQRENPQRNSGDTTMLHYVSRQDDTIIVAGLNVYPQQIEDIVLTHPHIIDAVVFKIEDVYAGHRVCLHYVADTSNLELKTNDVRSWCQQQMAEYQVPQQLFSVDKIDRMANGKISRKQLAMRVQKEIESTSTSITSSKIIKPYKPNTPHSAAN